jgi:hypothetical protein
MMKTKSKIAAKLHLRTETVRVLDAHALSNAAGGQFLTTACTTLSKKLSDCSCQTE